MPRRLVLVAGTTTDVGKTWATAGLARALRAGGATVAARKPVQSFPPGATTTDADVLAAATGEQAGAVCPAHRWYAAALAPPLAARALGLAPFTLADLVGELRWPPGVDYGLVEAVGGPRSPLADDADTAALARALTPGSTVLVADAGLGAINAVLLAAAALPGRPPVVLLNRYRAGDPVHEGNRWWLAEREALHVVVDLAGLVAALGCATSARRPAGRRPARGRDTGPSTPPA